MIFGLACNNFGADFVSFWIKFTVTVNFLLLVLKCLKFNRSMLQRPKIKLSVIEVPPKSLFLHAFTVLCVDFSVYHLGGILSR